MNNKRQALGRGLSALLHDAEQIQQKVESAPSAPKPAGPVSISEIPLSEIEPNPFQPRVTFDEVAIEELAESIRTLGIIQPLTLRRVSAHKYQIISGERRYRASIAAGLESVPAYIRQADDRGMLEMAIVENIQREDLDAIETAISFQRLMDECNLTQEAMADRVGKKRATVANYLRLLNLPAAIQQAVKVGKISAGHAKALLGIDDENTMLKLCSQCIKSGWSVRMLEDKIRKISTAAETEKVRAEQTLPDEYYRILEVVGQYFDNNISLKRTSKGSGTMTIRFASDEALARFLKVLEDNQI